MLLHILSQSLINRLTLHGLHFQGDKTLKRIPFNKRSPTQVVRFWGRSVLKLNPERAVEIREQIIIVQNFTADLMAQRPDFYPPPFGRYS